MSVVRSFTFTSTVAVVVLFTHRSHVAVMVCLPETGVAVNVKVSTVLPEAGEILPLGRVAKASP